MAEQGAVTVQNPAMLVLLFMASSGVSVTHALPTDKSKMWRERVGWPLPHGGPDEKMGDET